MMLISLLPSISFSFCFTIGSFVFSDAVTTPTDVLSDVDISISDAFQILINLDSSKAMHGY